MATSKDTIILSITADVYETSPPGSLTTWFCKASYVRVSICFDSTRNLCRIISVVGQTPIINSCITSASKFTESSGLFGTWFDERNETTFGVGFKTESDLKVFANAFETAKKKMAELNCPSPSEVSDSIHSIDNTSAGNSSSVQVSGVEDKNENPSASVSINNSNTFTSPDNLLKLPDWHDNLTGTSRNANFVYQNNETLLNNNSEINICTSGSCNICPISALPKVPIVNLPTREDNEFVVMNVHTKLSPDEITTVAQENAFLRKALTDASKNVTDWQLELDSHRKLSDALSKSKDDALKSMEEWKKKSYEYQLDAKIWRERCEKSEATAQELSEETIAKYKQQYKEAVSGKEYYKSVIQEKEMEIRQLKEQLLTKEASPSHTALTYKKENEALKISQARARQQESISTHVANEQWTVMRDAESRLADAIQRIIDVHAELKRSVKKGANLRDLNNLSEYN